MSLTISGTVFIDGNVPGGLPTATSVSSADGVILAQGGTPGVPGTATIREATLAQVLGGLNLSFLPTSNAGLAPGQLWNNGGFLAIA